MHNGLPYYLPANIYKTYSILFWYKKAVAAVMPKQKYIVARKIGPWFFRVYLVFEGKLGFLEFTWFFRVF
jgi:hypothetical protein